MASTMFNKYIWLVNTIYEAGRISKEDIDRRWASCYLNDNRETHIQTRAFHRYKESILMQFGLDIQCDRTTGKYYIADESDLKALPRKADIMLINFIWRCKYPFGGVKH